MEKPKFSYYEGGVVALRTQWELELSAKLRTIVSTSQSDAVSLTVNSHPSATVFLIELDRAWRKHNELGLYLDDLLMDLGRLNFLEIPPTGLNFLSGLLNLTLEVDYRKRMLSSGIKPVIDRELEGIANPFLSSQDIILAKTPQRGDIMSRRYLDLLRLAVNERYGSVGEPPYPQVTREFVAGEYFCDSLELLNLTYNKLVGSKTSDQAAILEEIEEIGLRIRRQQRNKGYFLLEHPSFKTVDRLLEYDNNQEYEFVMGMFGMPDYVFRKYLINGLIAGSFLDEKPSVLDYSDQELQSALDAFTKLREIEFNKEIRPYYNYGLKCGVACLLTVLGTYEDYVPSPSEESEIFNRIKKGDYPNNPTSGLALEAVRRGHRAVLVHSDRDFFHYSGEMSRNDYDVLTAHYIGLVKQAEGSGLEVKFGKITAGKIREFVKQGALVIPVLHLGKGVLHDMVIHGYDKDSLFCFDPAYGERKIEDRRINEMLVNPYGSWMVAIFDPKFQKTNGKGNFH